MTLRIGVGISVTDILNVKDFGAVGDGLHDDQPNIQNAFDSAFGSSGSPHGTNATLNKPVYFPGGKYFVGSPLTLTQVKGAHIFGSGQGACIIAGSSTVIKTNGFESCSFENFSIASQFSPDVSSFELDWDGTGSVKLQNNIFTNCSFGGTNGNPSYGMRIGLSGNGGAGNQFYACYFFLTSIAGLTTWSSGATGQICHGGGAASNLGSGYWIKKGQIASLNDVGLSGNSSSDSTKGDVLMDSDGPILVKGSRTESVTFFVFNSSNSIAVLDGNSASTGVIEYCHSKGKVICDSNSATFTSVWCSSQFSSYNGSAYFRGNVFGNANMLTAFSSFGTILQNI